MQTTPKANNILGHFFALLGAVVMLAIATWVSASSSEQVKPIDNLNVPRTGHTATALSDGRILITGGRDADGNLVAASEIFDPATQTSSASGTLHTARVDHSATVLADGRVLVAGGTCASGALSSAEIFDPEHPENGFTTVGSAMSTARTRHTATLLNNGSVLIAGGDAQGTAEIFDATTGTFSPTLWPLTVARSGHTATLFTDDSVLLAGGNNATMETYTAGQGFTLDPATMSVVRTGHWAFELSDTCLLLFQGDTGNSIDEFNPSTGTIAPKGTLDFHASSSTLLANGKVLVLGTGVSGLYNPDAVPPAPDFTAFDETTVPHSGILPRSGQSAVTLPGDKQILITGGVDGNNQLLGQALFNPASIWTDKDDYMPDEPVILSGSGWKANENVYLFAVDNETQQWTYESTVPAGPSGEFVIDPYFIVELRHAGVQFHGTALGAQSTMQADVYFTDSVVSATITSPTTGSPVTITSLPAIVTISFNYQTSASGTTTGEAQVQTPSTPSNTKSLTSGGPFSDSINVTIPAGTANGQYTVKLTVTNTSGSGSPNKVDTKSNAVIINVPSNHPPVAVCQNVTKSAGANCTATVSASELNGGSSDPDAGDTLSFSASPAGPYGIGTTNVTLTVTDNHGASATCNATVTVNDTTAPVITSCPSDITLYTGTARTTCDQVATWTASTATDNCHVASLTPNHNPGDTFPVGTTQVTYTATDDAGNTATCSFNVTVVDNTAPVPNATSLPDVTAQCSANLPPAPTATDNCDGTITGTPSNPGPFSEGDYTVTWTFTDSQGNSSTQTQAVHVHDTTAPVPNAGSLPAVIGQCSANLPAAPMATDNCDGAITGTPSNPGPFGQGDHTIVWTFTDGQGNSSTQTQAVHVHDTTAPVPNAGSLPDVTGQCSANLPAAPTATDNCDGAITGTPSNPGPFGQGDHTIVWTFTDGQGNSSTQTQAVHVHDTTAPVPNAGSLPDVTGQCSANLPAAPTATDNCDGAITGTPSNPGPFGQGDHTIVWTFTDSHGNGSTQNQAVHVHDTTPPVITHCAAARIIMAACAPASTLVPDLTGEVVATDNCSGVTVTQTPAAGTQVVLGDTTVTLHVSDAVGNEMTCTAILHVNYNFTGFFQPVDNIPTFNRVKAGSAIPVKFSLGCNQGLNILAAGFPQSGLVACDTHEPVDDVETTVNAGNSSLNYDATANQYIYVWKTDKAWAGTCRVLSVRLADGTYHYAYFNFTR